MGLDISRGRLEEVGDDGGDEVHGDGGEEEESDEDEEGGEFLFLIRRGDSDDDGTEAVNEMVNRAAEEVGLSGHGD